MDHNVELIRDAYVLIVLLLSRGQLAPVSMIAQNLGVGKT